MIFTCMSSVVDVDVQKIMKPRTFNVVELLKLMSLKSNVNSVRDMSFPLETSRCGILPE